MDPKYISRNRRGVESRKVRESWAQFKVWKASDEWSGAKKHQAIPPALDNSTAAQ